MTGELERLLDEYYVARHSKDHHRLMEAREAIARVGQAELDDPTVVRQFDGQPWVPLREAVRLHDAHQEAVVTVAGLRNSLDAALTLLRATNGVYGYADDKQHRKIEAAKVILEPPEPGS